MFNHHDIIRCMAPWRTTDMIGGGTLSPPRMLRPGKTSRFLLSFMFAIPHWQRRSLSWDNFRRTGLLERSLPTLW